MAAEADLAQASRFGVSPDTIAALRRQKLVNPDHWSSEGRAVVYTDEGKHELARLLGADAPDNAAAAAPKKEGGGGELATTEEPGNKLLVIKLHPNPLFVRVRTPEGEECDVQVASNKRLQPGFRLLCKRSSAAGWLCIQTGLQPRR